MRTQTDAEYIASLGLPGAPGADLSAVSAASAEPWRDVRGLGDLLGEIPDGPRRRAVLLRLVRTYGGAPDLRREPPQGGAEPRAGDGPGRAAPPGRKVGPLGGPRGPVVSPHSGAAYCTAARITQSALPRSTGGAPPSCGEDVVSSEWARQLQVDVSARQQGHTHRGSIEFGVNRVNSWRLTLPLNSLEDFLLVVLYLGVFGFDC